MLNELLTVESNLLLALNHFDVRVDVFIKRVHAYIYIYMCVFFRACTAFLDSSSM